jgi:hypothetical protein
MDRRQYIAAVATLVFSHRVAVSMACFFVFFLPKCVCCVCAVSIIIYRQCDRFILHANEWTKKWLQAFIIEFGGDIDGWVSLLDTENKKGGDNRLIIDW